MVGWEASWTATAERIMVVRDVVRWEGSQGPEVGGRSEKISCRAKLMMRKRWRAIGF